MVNPEQFGPHLFSLEAISPETQSANRRIAEATRNAPARSEIPLYTSGMEHSPTSATGTGWEPTPWHATQRAAWEELRKTDQ